MPFYLYQISYSTAAVKALLAKPQDRESAARKMIEAAGAKLHSFFFSFGSSDVVTIIEAPDDKTMAAISMTVAASGGVRSGSTTQLLSMDEAMQAMKTAGRIAKAYKSLGS